MMELTTSWQEKGRKEGRIEGRKEGRAEGKAEGKTEGRKEGIVEGQANILLRLLKKKFGNIPVEMEERVKSLSMEKLQELAEAIFELETLEDVQNFLR